MLVPAICPNCGGKLEVDDQKEAAVCECCGTPFITEKAINNYITQNNTYIHNTTIVNKDSADTLLQKGITQIEIGQYEDAIESFTAMSKDYPENWKSWFGLSLAMFNNMPIDGFHINERIYKILPDNVLEAIDEAVAPAEIENVERLEKKICNIQNDLEVLNEEKNTIEKSLEELKTNSSELFRNIFGWGGFGVVIGALSFFLGVFFLNTYSTMFGLFIMGGALYILYYFALVKTSSARSERSELEEEIEELEKEHRQLVKKIGSKKSKQNDYRTEQEELNQVLNDKLEAGGFETVADYYMEILKEY